MPNRYLVLSDLHLSDFEEHADGWRYYKSRAYDFDSVLANLIARFTGDARPEERCVLVLGGDVFDFDLVIATPSDAPFRVSRAERQRGLRPTAEKSAWKLRRILADHPGFLDALTRFLSAGHEVVTLLGNHDRELDFAPVRQVFVDALRNHAPRGEPSGGPNPRTTPEAWRLRFEPWFYYVPGEIYAEHGQQYDPYTAYRYLCSPRVRRKGEWEIALPTGNISNRYLMNKMGTFNPHASDYILNLYAYVAHWLKHYAFTKRNLVWSWFWGSLAVLAALISTKRKLRKPPPGCTEATEETQNRSGLDGPTLAALESLQRRPITSRLFRLVREFWLDRVLIAAIMTGGTITLALTPTPLWVKLMVPLSAFPLIYLLYELLASGETIFSAEARLPGVALRIARLLDVPVVAFGHTHAPRLVALEAGRTFVDTGTWAPITARSSHALKPGFRNYLILTFEAGSPRLQYDCAPIEQNEEGTQARHGVSDSRSFAAASRASGHDLRATR